MPQQSQVWWSFPGGIGWPTPIPLSGGKRSKTRKVRKATRRMRGGSVFTNMRAKVGNLVRTFKNKRNENEQAALNKNTKIQNELGKLRTQIANLKKQKTKVSAREGSAKAIANQKVLNEKITQLEKRIENL